MNPILEYILQGKLFDDSVASRKVRRRACRFAIIEEKLYRRSFRGSLLKCVSEQKVDYVLREICEGCCEDHVGGISLTRKAQLAGFWWPTMNKAAVKMVRSCEGCQRHNNFSHQTASVYKPISSSCPFDQWGLNIVGPFPIARAQKKILLVAVEYFSKWAEVEPLVKITEEEVLKFLWKNIVCRFGLPRKLISDNERQFQGKKITSWCQEMKITQSFTSVAYPQANGQTEVVNHILVQALKTGRSREGLG